MDAQEKEIAVFFCPDCDTEICPCVIERVRKQENAMVVAKQANETLEALNNQLPKQLHMTEDELKKWKEKAQETLKADIAKKRAFLDAKHNKFLNRQKLV